MTVQSAVMKSFYINMQTWIDAGCPEHPVFKKDKALCLNLYNYTTELGANQHMRHTITGELIAQFRAAKLNDGFPFNNPVFTYISEQDRGDFYQNKNRLAWVKSHAEGEPHG